MTTTTRPADVSAAPVAAPLGMTIKRIVAAVAYMTAIAALLVVAYGMHANANATPVQPTWQQPVVTIDDAEVVAVAQTWGAPFEVRFAADADITVTRAMKGTHVGGEATKTVDGDTITGCTITLRPETLTDAVIAHEVGHCFGLHHDNGHSDSLMYWIQGGASGAAGVTDHDRGELANLYAA